MTTEASLAYAEEAVCAAALCCSAETVQSVGLNPQDFLVYSCRQIWGHVLRMKSPSILLLMDIDADLAVSAQAWIGRFDGVHNQPGSLRAHAGLVKREARIRAIGQGNAQQINELRAGKRVDWWSAYEVIGAE